ncbi:sensor histidine kinase [bacterium D16-54]|nr:sensor histidine kinase [bacterium D16-54]RKJ11087.1 sensor histidine kinase [bacterium D16-56]
MEKVKRQSLKRSFMKTVAMTMLIVFLCSGLAIFGCYRFQKHILPDFNEVWLTQQTTAPDGTVTEAKMRYVLDGPPEPFGQLVADGQEHNGSQGQTSYMIERIESSYSMLSPKAATAYRISQICMVLLPFLFAVIGITLCAWWFYHKVLEPPITVLMDATAHIGDRDLNFQIIFDGQDELGQLCTAFEKMRQTLYENNRQMWSMLEERRALQASVAHDLRNPIAIMTGYVEYLQENNQGGTLTEEKLEKALSNLGITAERMGRYTDTMRDLGAIEETEVHRREVELPDFLQHMADSLSILFQNTKVHFFCDIHVPKGRAVLDGELLYRVLENLISNALRFAEREIGLTFCLEHGILSAAVTDDGPGFSDKLLKKKTALFYSEDTSGQHLGLGLAVSRVLCQKHGGTIELSNRPPHGACVKASIKIEQSI